MFGATTTTAAGIPTISMNHSNQFVKDYRQLKLKFSTPD